MEKGGGQLEVPLDHLAQHVVRPKIEPFQSVCCVCSSRRFWAPVYSSVVCVFDVSAGVPQEEGHASHYCCCLVFSPRHVKEGTILDSHASRRYDPYQRSSPQQF